MPTQMYMDSWKLIVGQDIAADLHFAEGLDVAASLDIVTSLHAADGIEFGICDWLGQVLDMLWCHFLGRYVNFS